MTWDRFKHIAGAAAGLIVAIGPQLLPVIPPMVGAVLGPLITLVANLDKIRGKAPPA